MSAARGRRYAPRRPRNPLTRRQRGQANGQTQQGGRGEKHVAHGLISCACMTVKRRLARSCGAQSNVRGIGWLPAQTRDRGPIGQVARRTAALSS
jgi:hypothetical protein